MSTLSGIAAKGEKGKPKFQSLDINNLYSASRGESLATHQHKNTSSRRHGMQTLGKIPSARRAPANLPSLKSEYSGNDPAINLVPSGGTGWGNKPGETGPPPTSTIVVTTTTVTAVSVTSTPVTATVTVSVPTPTTTAAVTLPTIPSQSQGDKSWSSITSSGTETTPMFLAHQSPYFQQEFPSLSGDANATSGMGPNKSDTTHLPGPSLRPQTEGSWVQGGSRSQGQMVAGVGNQQGIVPAQGPLLLPHLPQGLEVSGGRNNLAPSGVAVGPVGPPIPPTADVAPHHYRLMPQFMIRHNHPPGGFPPNYQHGSHRPRFPYPPDTRFMPPGSSNVDHEELASRPIIKEEELKGMDEIARDTGWAVHDEIDYNQTLAFSDEEGAQDDEPKAKAFRHALHIVDKKATDNNSFETKETDSLECDEKINRESSRETIFPTQNENREVARPWQQPRPADSRQGVPPPIAHFSQQPARVPNHQGGRQGEDEEVWRERRRLQNEEIAIAIERAKQRKEVEEKRYEETRQAAARKLQILEEKMRSTNGGEKEENNVSPSQSVPHGHGPNTLLPDWEKEKEKNRSRTNSEEKDEKAKEPLDSIRNVQGDTRSSNFGRERERERERELRPDREGVGQPFSRQFQSNLPPRFQKQAAERPLPYYRQNSGGSPQPSHSPYEVKWPVGTHFGGSAGNVKAHRSCNDNDMPEQERDENKESNIDCDRHVDPALDNCERERYEKNDEIEDFVNEKNKESNFHDVNIEVENKSNENQKTSYLIQTEPFNERGNACDIKVEPDRPNTAQKPDLQVRPDRPQRPDSRDSRTSRDSRNSRESIREDNKFVEEKVHEASLSWADSTYEMDSKEEKCRKDIPGREERDTGIRRDMHTMQTYHHQRHIPGPITKEKLEASELKSESTRNLNLVPLVRSDKKLEPKKTENKSSTEWQTGGNSGDAWQRVSGTSSQCWAEVTVPAQAPDSDQNNTTESHQKKEERDENKGKPSPQDQEDIDASHKTEPQRDKMVNRGGIRGLPRHEPRVSRQGWGNSFYRGSQPWRGEGRGGRRGQNRRPNVGREWVHSESEASADEVSASTESGKEDHKHQYPSTRSKQGFKKTDKDERPRDNRKVEVDKDNFSLGGDNRRHEKRGMYDGNRIGSGFEPRGEPSRRGRGAPFRSKGTATNVGRRMDGYGPPTSKRPFTSEPSHVHEDRKNDDLSSSQLLNKEDALTKMSHDEKIKINQQQLSAGIIGNSSRPGMFKSQSSTMPPRLRRKSEGERRDRKLRDSHGPRESIKSGSGSGGEVGDDNWETTSEVSEQDDKERGSNDDRQNDSLQRNYSQTKSQSRPQSQANRHLGKEKRRGGSYDRERDHNSRGSISNSGPQSVMNGNGRMQSIKTIGSAKDLTETKTAEQSADKKQPRTDNKDKRNNLDRIDLCNTASVVVVDDQPEVTVEGDQTIFATDNNGFQEVRSKKNVKEANRQQKEDRSKPSKPPSSLSPGPTPTSHPSASSANKGSYERSRPTKLPPRFAKLRENNRLQKMAQQQQTQDAIELNKINQGGLPVFPLKDMSSPAPPPSVNAWDKPITAALRTSTPPAAPNTAATTLSDPCNNIETSEQVHSAASSQRSSPSDDKTVGKLPREPTEKNVLDGTSPPVQTIIFENTNYKSAPVDVAMKSKYSNQINNKTQRPEKPKERKLEEDNASLGFKSPVSDMKLQETKADSIPIPLSFNKNEDNADMKLDFRFDSDLSQLTDDKTSKAIQMTRSIQIAAQSSAADLQFKLASVKKVWENSPGVLEHVEDPNAVPTATSFTPTFGSSVEDSASYSKTGVDSTIADDASTLASDGVYNSGQQLQNSSNTYNTSTVQNMIKPDPSSNVCKLLAPQVKPQPQATMHPHSGPLSPPAGAFNTLPAQPNQQINYQVRDSKLEPKAWIQIRESDSQKTGLNQSLVYTYLSNCDEPWHKVQPPGADPQQFQQCRPNMTSPAQYGGIPAIPSPPTVFTPQAELYPTFQINNPQVMGSQGRSQFSQFASPYLSQGLSQTSGFSQQSLYLHQTAPPPPPNAAPPDMFPTQLSQYRIQPPGYGASQQLSNNPNTVLISSSSNSLMSASVKPSPQPIGSKAASYQAPSQPPPSQLYIYPDPQLLNQSHFSQLVQRPASNVVPNIPPSSASYYSANTGGGATGFYQPGNSSMQAAAQSMHQPTFGMQAFNTQSPAATPAGMGSFGSTMAQQYRSTALSYLKSAPDHQDVLSVFSSPATQVNSPKSRGNSSGSGGSGKSSGTSSSSQQQPSPTQSHHKLSTYQQNVSPTTQLVMQQQQQRGSLSMRVAPRYPAPIQRPPPAVQSLARHRFPPTRYKLPPAATATGNHYYPTPSNPAKLDNSNLEAKVDVNSECEDVSIATANNTTDVTADDTTSAND